MHGSREASFTVHLAERALGQIAYYRLFIITDILLGYDEWKGEKCVHVSETSNVFFNKN